MNATYAEATTRTGQTVGVSFWVADPPAVSHLCIHCPGMKATHFEDEPLVVCSAKDIAVIRVAYTFGARPIESMEGIGMDDFDYFVYRAHAEKKPSLQLLPNPKPLFFDRREIVGLLPSADGEDFLMAVLQPRLRLVALLEPPSPGYKDNKHPLHRTHKVITLDGGTLGWVDLGRGILQRNLLDSEPVVRYLKIPGLLASNMPAALVRDVTCSNGVIKLIEIEKRTTRLVTPPARPSKGKRNRAAMEGTCTTAGSYAVDGWAAVTWTRKTGSGRCRDGEAYFSGSSILAALRDNRGTGNLALQNLVIAGPVWSVHGDDVFYLMAKADSKDRNAWAISVNVRTNTLEVAASFAAERDLVFIRRAYHPFALSKYMDERQTVAQGGGCKQIWQPSAAPCGMIGVKRIMRSCSGI
uniref:DUF1618 domain-containing protein n=1 Tax=Setaria viridis TaxID=4556 RepID=A0A4U6TA99_SETVI|nr:hypothetical protein SEVIR_9G482700v2 [Setaria viridis]